MVSLVCNIWCLVLFIIYYYIFCPLLCKHVGCYPFCPLGGFQPPPHAALLARRHPAGRLQQSRVRGWRNVFCLRSGPLRWEELLCAPAVASPWWAGNLFSPMMQRHVTLSRTSKRCYAACLCVREMLWVPQSAVCYTADWAEQTGLPMDRLWLAYARQTGYVSADTRLAFVSPLAAALMSALFTAII